MAGDSQGVGRLAASIPGSSIEVSPNAQLGRITRVAIPLAGTASKPAYQFLLKAGAVDITIDESKPGFDVKVVHDQLVELPKGGEPAEAVLVRSPRGEVAVVVKGAASFRVRNGHMTVINRKGKTLVGSVKSVRALQPGYAKSFGCSAGSAERIVPPAPTFTARRRFWVVDAAGSVQPSGLTWTASQGASSYHVTVRRSLRDAPIVDVDVEQTGLGSEAPELYPGDYFAQVQPVDACGIKGSPSEPLSLRVVGVALPLGGYIDDSGAIRVNVRQPVRLTNAHDLFVRFSEEGGWVPAPKQLQLFSEREQRIEIRPGDAAITEEIRIAPRGLRADVDMNPARAHWPGQPIDVTVQLEASEGRSAPAWIVPRPRVLVGVRPLYVKWKRQGDRLHATIPPQPGNGPWIVRVEVKDQFGHVLGRNFLEVSNSDG